MKIVNQGFDHVEFAVKDIVHHAKMYQRMGFEMIGQRRSLKRGTRSEVWAQGFVRIMLTEALAGSSQAAQQEPMKFLSCHGDGICVLALEVDDAREFFKQTVARGARPALEPQVFESLEGQVVRAEIWTPEDIRYAFIQRKAPGGLKSKALLDEDLVVDRLESPSPLGIRLIDHLTNNVSIGEMPKWVSWYKKVFEFTVTRHFNITTGRTGLNSDVVQSPDHKIKVPVNEATEPQSQVQEFVDRFKGAGVQHLALLTTDLISTLKQLRKNDFKFLTVPSTYYEMVPKRVKNFSENLKELEELQILLDGEGEGYLLQIFSEELVGPFFFEYIQRKGNQGFGEGNFKALFEAIERDQVRRGVL